MKKLEVNDYSFAQLTLILLLYYITGWTVVQALC